MEFFKLITGLVRETQGLLPGSQSAHRAAMFTAVHCRLTFTGRLLCTRHVRTTLSSLENVTLPTCCRHVHFGQKDGSSGQEVAGPAVVMGPRGPPGSRPHAKPGSCALILHLAGMYFPSFIQQICTEPLPCAQLCSGHGTAAATGQEKPSQSGHEGDRRETAEDTWGDRLRPGCGPRG